MHRYGERDFDEDVSVEFRTLEGEEFHGGENPAWLWVVGRKV